MISSMLPPFYHLVAFRSAVWLEGHFAVPRLAPPCLQFEDLLQAPAMVRYLSSLPRGAIVRVSDDPVEEPRWKYFLDRL